MGLLDKLWDDTIGGPQPDKGPKRSKSIDIVHEDVGSPTSVASSPGFMSRFPFPLPYSPRSLPSSTELTFKKVMTESAASGEKRVNNNETRRISRSISIAKSSPTGPLLDRSTSLPTSFSSNASTPSSVSPGCINERIGDSVWDRVMKSDNNRMDFIRENTSMSPDKFQKPDDNTPTVFGWYNPID